VSKGGKKGGNKKALSPESFKPSPQPGLNQGSPKIQESVGGFLNMPQKSELLPVS